MAQGFQRVSAAQGRKGMQQERGGKNVILGVMVLYNVSRCVSVVLACLIARIRMVRRDFWTEKEMGLGSGCDSDGRIQRKSGI